MRAGSEYCNKKMFHQKPIKTFRWYIYWLLIGCKQRQWLGLNAISAFALACMTVGGAVEHNDIIQTNLMMSYWLDQTPIHLSLLG